MRRALGGPPSRHPLSRYVDSRMRRSVSRGRSQCGKCPQSENQCREASGNSWVARSAWLGAVTRSLRPHPMTTRPRSRTSRRALLFRSVDQGVAWRRRGWGTGEFAQLLQHQVGGQPPRLRRELQQQRGAPDRARGQGRQQGLDAPDQRDRRDHGRSEQLHLAVGPEAAGVERDDVAAMSSAGQLQGHPGAHRTSDHVDPAKTLFGDELLDGVGQRRDGHLTAERGCRRNRAGRRRRPCAPGRATERRIPVVQVGDAVHQQEWLAGAGPH